MVVFEHLRINSFEQFVDEAHTLRDHRVLPSRLARTQPLTSAGSALCPRQPSGFPFPSFSHWRDMYQDRPFVERDVGGTGFLFEEPNPTGSRPSDLIGLYRKWQWKKGPTGEKEQQGRGGGRQGLLF